MNSGYLLNIRAQSKTPCRESAQNCRAGDKNRAIHQLFRHKKSSESTRVETFQGDVAVQRCIVQAGEQPEVVTDRHLVILWEAQVVEFELTSSSGHYWRKKYPNAISSIVPGFVPAHRAPSPLTYIVCALSPRFVSRIAGELDRPTLGSFHGLTDMALTNIMRLLNKETEDGLPSGRLYIESLSTALVTRLLHLSRPDKQLEPERIGALPHHPLHRVLDRMQSDIHADPDLQTLASEAGYSQSHFLRMFRAATGTTPHQFLLDLKLDKVKELLATRKIPLIDIAAACGFSSHSHLSTAFRKRFGATPSHYAREINRK